MVLCLMSFTCFAETLASKVWHDRPSDVGVIRIPTSSHMWHGDQLCRVAWTRSSILCGDLVAYLTDSCSTTVPYHLNQYTEVFLKLWRLEDGPFGRQTSPAVSGCSIIPSELI